MKVTRQQAQANRTRVLQLAARRFRERGFQGVGVAELMREAGLTHGGFYKQFTSKDDLIAQACAEAIRHNLECYRASAAKADNPAAALESVIAGIFSREHRSDWADGCALAALGSDIARAEPKTRQAITQGIEEIIAYLAELHVATGTSHEEARRQALRIYTLAVGSLLLSRAINDTELSDEVLEAARAEVGSLNPAATPL